MSENFNDVNASKSLTKVQNFKNLKSSFYFLKFWHFWTSLISILTFLLLENQKSVLYDEFGVDCDLIDKLFYFFNRQSLLLAGKQDIKLYSILAGIILFAPDRGLSKLSYRKSKIGSDFVQNLGLGSNCTIQNMDPRTNRQFQITIISTWYKVYKTNVLIFYKDMSKDIALLRKVY